MSDDEYEYEYDSDASDVPMDEDDNDNNFDDEEEEEEEEDEFEYTDEEEDQADDGEVAIENEYYNAKGLKEDNDTLSEALETFENVILRNNIRQRRFADRRFDTPYASYRTHS